MRGTLGGACLAWGFVGVAACSGGVSGSNSTPPVSDGAGGAGAAAGAGGSMDAAAVTPDAPGVDGPGGAGGSGGDAGPTVPTLPANATWKDRLLTYATPALWPARKAEIRTQILVSAGLWPELTPAAVRPEIFGKIDREGYSVEKVRLETWPGFYLTGNLYRPRGKTGPFPGVISPHGHWANGRFENDKEDGKLIDATKGDICSVPGRAISLARMGIVVFSYDMVNFGDLLQLKLGPPNNHYDVPFGDPAWQVGLLGLQLWDSQRAIDFITGLPDVDGKHVGVTGASGGGTQTFLVSAVDPRVTCSVPVNMVSAEEYQGGSRCENAPGLRIDLNDAEMAAAVAPNHLLIIATTGDWTYRTPAVVGPVLSQLYQGLGVPDRFKVVQFDFPHNYNTTSREAAYAWFATCLQGAVPADRIPEPPFTVEPHDALSVLVGAPPPANLIDADGLTAYLRKTIGEQLAALAPVDGASLEKFRGLMRPGLKYLLGTKGPTEPEQAAAANAGRRTLIATTRAPDAAALADALRKKGETVDVITLAAHPAPTLSDPKAQMSNYPNEVAFPNGYFRTALGWQVNDLLAAVFQRVARTDVKEIRLIGVGDAGVATLLARALAPSSKMGAAVADLAGFDASSAAAWTGAYEQTGMMRVGGLPTAAMLVAPAPLVLHNTQGKFPQAGAAAAFRAAGAAAALKVGDAKLTNDEIAGALGL